MTREEAIKMVQAHKFPKPTEEWQMLNNEAIDMAISALSVIDIVDLTNGNTITKAEYDGVSRKDTVTLNSPISIQADMVAVVRCKDCRYANECHKSVQYTRNEPRTVTIGYSPIKWCSRGERREE